MMASNQLILITGELPTMTVWRKSSRAQAKETRDHVVKASMLAAAVCVLLGLKVVQVYYYCNTCPSPKPSFCLKMTDATINWKFFLQQQQQQQSLKESDFTFHMTRKKSWPRWFGVKATSKKNILDQRNSWVCLKWGCMRFFCMVSLLPSADGDQWCHF